MNRHSIKLPHILNLTLLIVLGCGTKEEREAATYIKDKAVEEALIQKQSDFYQKHQDQLVVKINQCNNLTQEAWKASKDCKSASRAQSMLGW